MAAVSPTHCWRLPAPHAACVREVSQELGLPELAVALLHSRGYTTVEEMRAFLEPSPARLRKPDLLPDIGPATERILAAIQAGERILVYGDYDVDGVTGTALLVSTFKRVGADVLYYLPHRAGEGYGLSAKGIEFAAARKVKLIVTNDCGSSDFGAVAAATDAGIDVVITDHHELAGRRGPDPESGTQKPEMAESDRGEAEPATAQMRALAVVNPKRTDSAYPFRELAGVGVAFKLAWSVLSALGRPREELTCLLDLVGLGTVSDVVPLVDENRILARLGLNAIRRSARPGLQALLKVAGIANRPLSGYSIGFMLGPRINAAGRVGHAEKAVRLFLTEDEAEAAALAAELDGLNRSRQSLEEQVLGQASILVEAEHLAERRTIVVAGEGWHEGVIGIVAARLVERYFRPCIVVSLHGNQGKGSGRSVSGFDLYAALQTCSEHLLGFGGHKYAAGLKLERDRLRSFSSALAEHADRLPEEVFEPTLHIDAVAAIEQLNDALVSALEKFEPFGPDNTAPLFASFDVEVVGYPRKVGNNHLKLTLRGRGRTVEAMAWRRSAEIVNLGTDAVQPGQEPNSVRFKNLDICYTIGRRTYGGRTSMQLTLRDFKTAHHRE